MDLLLLDYMIVYARAYNNNKDCATMTDSEDIIAPNLQLKIQTSEIIIYSENSQKSKS